MGEVAGIDTAAVTAWIQARAEVTPPLSFEIIQGGRSNLTFTVTDTEGRRLILRRPPLHSVLASAHDMGREHRLMSALEASDVPVPHCVGYEPDPEVNGAPFYVMEHVDGAVVRSSADARSLLTPAIRQAASDDLVDVLVRLHDVDIDAVGLGDLSRKDGYVERQLRRWRRQLEEGSTRQLPLLLEVHDRLAADVPVQQGASTVVHGDYRLDNVIVDPADGAVQAVLDWEIATLGDPLADVGVLLVYWTEASDTTFPLDDPPTVVEGFRSRDEVIERYAERSGRDLSQIDYYTAFGYWKMACILEGVYTRYRSGAYGDASQEETERFGEIVPRLAEVAHEVAKVSGR